jgi:hypothetical protein
MKSLKKEEGQSTPQHIKFIWLPTGKETPLT